MTTTWSDFHTRNTGIPAMILFGSSSAALLTEMKIVRGNISKLQLNQGEIIPVTILI